MLAKTKKIEIVIDEQDDHIAIIFSSFRDLKKAFQQIRSNFKVKSSWKNWISFYLIFFDDYFKCYKIDNCEFIVEPDGHNWMEGLALVTQKSNMDTFNRIISTLEDIFEIKGSK